MVDPLVEQFSSLFTLSKAELLQSSETTTIESVEYIMYGYRKVQPSRPFSQDDDHKKAL